LARPVGLKIGGHWGPIFETRCSQHPRNTLLPRMCYHIKFRRCWSDILYVRIGVQKNSGDAVARAPWDKGQETCTYPACVTVPISSLWVKPSGRRKRSQHFWDAGAPSLWMGTWLNSRNMLLPNCVTMPNSVISGQTVRA